MISQAQTITLRPHWIAALLIGAWACTIEDAEPSEQELAVEPDEVEPVDSPSAVDSNVEVDLLAGLIKPPEIDENAQIIVVQGLVSTSGSRVQADFDGDGYSDLAIGVPVEEVNGVAGAGGVHVLYGSASGLTATDDQFWTQDSPGVLGEGELADLFGAVLAAGDFDNDGYSDLAIAAPIDVVGSDRAGAVNVLYGSASGLTDAGNQLWHQDSPGIEGVAEEGDVFGFALTSGDFNEDGYFDLAVGVPEDDESGAEGAGLVNVIYGSANGLTEVGNQAWHQDTPGVDGIVELADSFGFSLAAGDFDRDGRDDLAIGAPGEGVGSIAAAGAVNVLYGSSSGLSGSGNQYWHQDSEGIDGVAEQGDAFGHSLAVGDFDDDGFDDLVATAPAEDVGSIQEAGAVNVIYGSSSGLDEAGDQYWHQDSSGVDQVAELNDHFGTCVAAGDFDEDGRDDLAISVPDEDLGSLADAGLVHVLYGSGGGLSEDDDQIWHQDTEGVDGVAEASDNFGGALSVGDFDGDDASDLAIGVPREDVGSVADAGAINVLYGTGSGLTEDDDQVWHQDSPGVLETAEPGDLFGFSVR